MKRERKPARTAPGTAKRRLLFPALAALMVGIVGSGLAVARSAPDADWRVYGGNAAGQRYSTLDQIDRSNVSKLVQAWRFDTGEGTLQTSPLVVGRTMFGYTPQQEAIALDATNGRELWRFQPGDGSRQPARGMTYWQSGSDRRLFVTNKNDLWALDPATGKPIAGFGAGGKLDLRKNLGLGSANSNAVFLTTPGVIYKDLIITGFRTSEAPPAAPGDIRAFDVRTGKLRWTFHTIPQPGEPGHKTWPAEAWRTAGGANAWAGMVVDEKRGIVFAPTGSAAYDFYGGDRHGDNLYANSLLALDAKTGKRLWHFQAVHHDIWDRDFPSPPVLLTVRHKGKLVDAVAQATKQGFLFLFDRVTGKPLFPIEERPVPASDVPGEQAAPTQPYALKPAPFARQLLTEDMLTTRTPAAHADALKRFRAMRSEGQFVPLSLDKRTIIFPGFDGGAEWGGQAADPAGVVYINGTDVPYYSGLRPNRTTSATPLGERLYLEQCSACHGADRKGSPPQMPTLVGVQLRRQRGEVEALIKNGTGRMPGFPQLSAAERGAVTDYLMGTSKIADSDLHSLVGDMRGLPYLFTGYSRFNDPDGYPAVAPPWGTLSAIDMNTGDYLWRVPLGEYPELVAKGMPNTGSENYGGPLVTKGGLVFIAATIFDRKFRAFDNRTGALLWQAALPFTGLATPITYRIDGRQYVLIAASGGRDPKGPKGSAYIAFALPQS